MKCYRYTLYYPMVNAKPQCYPLAPAPTPSIREECNYKQQATPPRKTKLEVTFFDRVGDDFIRSCTTIRKEDGTCARGTLLDPVCPAYCHLMNGTDYVGEVSLFGKTYFPRYAPIKNKEGRVIGAICVGKCIC